ncbi:MAG: DUF6470 family protein [Oscillospiraceae bacterium]|jgi:hypothetical protein|nr:DUF6470 family protein [Oscillospiraceae bacterium]
MRLKQIGIEQQRSLIGLNVTPAKLEITNNVRRIKSANMELSTPKISGIEPPAFTLDFSALMSDFGNKSAPEFTQSAGQEASAACMQGVAKTSSDGDYLASTEFPGNRVAELQKRDNQAQEHDFNVGVTPRNPPDISWDELSIPQVKWSKPDLQLEWDEDYMPEVTASRADVEVYLQNSTKMKISVTEPNNDVYA